MPRFSFIHAADLHLDASFHGLCRRLLAPAEGGTSVPVAGTLARILRDASFTALERLVKLCIRERVDFLLLAGDVYNSAESSLRARLALRDAFLRLQAEGIAVFLAHGNHDPMTPLEKEGTAIPWPTNVTVFEQQVGVYPAYAAARPGEEGGRTPPVALVHGISHASSRESGNLARLFKRKNPSLVKSKLPQIGLLHCAVSGLSGGHEAYAPCSFADLAAVGLDYWALGHVHTCYLLDQGGRRTTLAPRDISGSAFANPLAAYPGSLQGLHVNETGPHGCLRVHVDETGHFETSFIPLAPVQWETLVLEPGQEMDTVPMLESMLIQGLEALSPFTGQGRENGEGEKRQDDLGPEAVLVRVCLRGRSLLDHDLRKLGALDDLRDHLSSSLEGSGVWLRDLVRETRPMLDMEAALERSDLAGEVLRTVQEISADPVALAQTAEHALRPLFSRLKARRFLPFPDATELAALAGEAAFVCLDMLSPDAGDEPDNSVRRKAPFTTGVAPVRPKKRPRAATPEKDD